MTEEEGFINLRNNTLVLYNLIQSGNIDFCCSTRLYQVVTAAANASN